MARRAKPSSLSCEMVDLTYVFIIFSFEKERSALDTMSGNTYNNAHAVVRCRTEPTEDRIPQLLTNLSKSSVDSEAAISMLNSRRNERNLNTKLEPKSPEYAFCSPFAAVSKSLSDRVQQTSWE